MENNKKNNGRGIFYGVIGIATLVVAIIGATFAYFTASQSVDNVITGNMATINFSLGVKKITKVDQDKGGMIPMSNSMVQKAAEGTGGVTCTDDNGNAVCQIYEISVDNNGSASVYIDGFVSLYDGSGLSTDIPAKHTIGEEEITTTTMRWAQVTCSAPESAEGKLGCTTALNTTTGATDAASNGNIIALASIDDGDTEDMSVSADTGKNKGNIAYPSTGYKSYSDIKKTGYINGNEYDIISKNFIRTSLHKEGSGEDGDVSYKREADYTSALVFNQYLAPASAEKTDDSVKLYIIVWLSETGTNQTFDSGLSNVPGKDAERTSADNFFRGNVAFISGQGSEVTATFSGYTAVQSNT